MDVLFFQYMSLYSWTEYSRMDKCWGSDTFIIWKWFTHIFSYPFVFYISCCPPVTKLITEEMQM